MREALAGLTTRGRAIVVAGVVLLLLSWLLGQRDLLRVGVLALALPVIAGLLVTRARFRVTCARGVSATRVPRGSTADSVIRLSNSSRLPTGQMVLADQVPDLLAAPAEILIDRLSPGGAREASTTLHANHRGCYTIGPASLTLRDPFGLCEVRRSFTASDTLLVTPRPVDLSTPGASSPWEGRGDGGARALAHGGNDDVLPREYRVGDELRRVHWRATARSGELMVRREEQPWRTSATVVLDRRASSHRALGPYAGFELAVTVAASVAVHLARRGWEVRIIDLTGTVVAAAPAGAESALLESLAVVTMTSGPDRLEPTALRRRADDGTVVAVLGHLSTGDCQAVAALRSGGAPLAPVALLVEPDRESMADELAVHGWRTATVESEDQIADAWLQVSSPLGAAR